MRVLRSGYFFTSILLLIALYGKAMATPVTLTIHHFLSPESVTHKNFIKPWSEKIENHSKGKIRFEIFPSMTLGGKPPDLYKQVRDGVSDIVWTLPGYTPGVFPRSEVFELPFIHQNSALITNLAIQDVYDDFLASDYRDIHPILIHVHSGQALHMVSKPVRHFDDLRGLKLRIPSRSGAWMIDSWHGKPVGMPVPELPQALSRNVIDGGLIPFEIAIPLRVHQLTRYSIEGENGLRFGTAMFLFAMNKKRYEELDSSLRKIIDKHSGRDFARATGILWDQAEKKAKEKTRQTGSEIITLSDENLLPFRKAGQETVNRWLKEAKKQGFDGKKLLKAARDAIAKNTP